MIAIHNVRYVYETKDSRVLEKLVNRSGWALLMVLHDRSDAVSKYVLGCVRPQPEAILDVEQVTAAASRLRASRSRNRRERHSSVFSRVANWFSGRRTGHE
jgi:hypothetical protein